MIKFLQVESSEAEGKSKNILKLVNSTIESSVQLRDKIKRYLYLLKINAEQFQDIQFIISSIPKSVILFKITRRDLLISLMVNALSSHSYEFFKQWFDAFLLFDDEANEVTKREYLDLIQHWSKQFSKSDEIIMKILMDIDRFNDKFQNQSYQLLFIHHMVNFCFQQSKIFFVILNYRTIFFI